ncbi:MAG: translation elongation factor Ts [Nitrospirota bacterium]|jgi:elongation factor Ts
MAEVTATMVKELREKTGVGMMQCKKALTESSGDMERAVEILREKGLASAQKKVGRVALQGLIASYIHMDKLGVLVEINCETDFVAKTDDFRELAKDTAMHIAAANPAYLNPEEVPDEVIRKEREIARAQIAGKKPDNIVEQILEGKLRKFYEENCLTEQVFVKDPEGKLKIKDLITEKVAKLGENIVIRRFARFALGETQD